MDRGDRHLVGLPQGLAQNPGSGLAVLQDQSAQEAVTAAFVLEGKKRILQRLAHARLEFLRCGPRERDHEDLRQAIDALVEQQAQDDASDGVGLARSGGGFE